MWRDFKESHQPTLCGTHYPVTKLSSQVSTAHECTTEVGTPVQHAGKCKYKEEKYKDWYSTQVLNSTSGPFELCSSQSQEHLGEGGHRGYRKPNEIYRSSVELSVNTKPEFVGSNRKKKNYFSWRTSSHGIKVGSLILKKPLAVTGQTT